MLIKTHLYSGHQIGVVNFKGERDTIVVCVRGDGKRMPLFWIEHKRKGQMPTQYSNIISSEEKIAGMNKKLMFVWAQMALEHMNNGDVLIMDRLSSHLSNELKELFLTKNVRILLLPAKGSLLLSPLDRGFFGQFQKIYPTILNKMNKKLKDRKKKACIKAHDSIPKENVVKFFKNCGLYCTDTMEEIEKNFKKEMGVLQSSMDQKRIE